jgi:NAD(P)-dependent dehydrogenase (short-subunit alcohol dehydrogenase family)
VLGARDPETAQAAADVLATEGVSVSTATLDVTSPEPIRSAVEGIECDHDRLDILANNAGVFLDKNDAAETIDLDRIRRTMEINTYGSILLCQPRCP